MFGKFLISVVGPTAIGKTKMAIALAQHFDTEIISADSRQLYKEMKIGTAVPTLEELNTAPHHFIQYKSIFDTYSVGDFEQDASSLLKRLFTKKSVVIMAGGSGLYVDAVVQGLDKFPEVAPEIRRDLNNRMKVEGIQVLQRQLKRLDPLYFSKVDLENPHRLIRALEICIGTGRPYSSFLKGKKQKRFFSTIQVGLQADRKIIYDRINKRVDLMMEAGFLEEAKSLFPHRKKNALQTVGYKELFNYLEGIWELDFAISEIKKNTRRFAKRQLTWFRKDKSILWFPYDCDVHEIIESLKPKMTIGDE
ncbi:tRNA (adenosine(37)-N6)-dimethylallyltransferase MiaA [Ulvibacterium sp.]|uniref:tRNA (adenosine(37)-N6)-dimethylallyltransferase MiaA n=1 Tax=Ulvibacterium sp. TaxID=2665914 RepID=UPI002612F285|nr:tRNA (adenosine(37)-N6)-dimethylallyltransferase MiaA [Ulvibacterium sp.]